MDKYLINILPPKIREKALNNMPKVCNPLIKRAELHQILECKINDIEKEDDVTMLIGLKDNDIETVKFDSGCSCTVMSGEYFDKLNVKQREKIELNPAPWLRFKAASGHRMQATQIWRSSVQQEVIESMSGFQ